MEDIAPRKGRLDQVAMMALLLLQLLMLTMLSLPLSLFPFVISIRGNERKVKNLFSGHSSGAV